MAILLVIGYHTAAYIPDFAGENFVFPGEPYTSRFLMNGWSGVNIFFVLSGFLITRQLLQLDIANPLRQKESIRTFLIRRFFRIVPAYYCALFLGLLLFVNAGGTTSKEVLEISFWHILFFNDYYPSSFFGHFWSLAVEAKFYFLAPFVIGPLLTLRNEKAQLGIIATTLMALLVFRIILVQNNTNPDDSVDALKALQLHSSFDSLVTGTLCAFLWKNNQISSAIRNPLVANTLFLGGIGMFLFLMIFFQPYFPSPGSSTAFFTQTFYFSFLAISAGMLLLGLAGNPAAHRVFCSKIAAWIAKVSYSLYLLHVLFLVLLMPFANQYIIGENRHLSLWLTGYALVLALCLPLSALMYRAVEWPFISWSHKLAPMNK